jgi:GT2 family glycosyltransferase
MPLAVEPPSGEQILPRGHFGINDDAFVFGCIFDVGSGLARKNPQAAIEAFIREFGERSDVVLLLKYHGSRHDREGLRALHGLAAGRNNIRFFGYDFSQQENVSFKRHLNCLVSPHRSEGFGLNLAEAMVLGIPLIATGYSGNMDFMDETNSYLLDYRLTEVREREQFGPYRPGSLWADPSADDLAGKMREVFEDRGGAARRAARGRERILRDYSPEGFSEALAARMDALELFKPGGEAFRRSWGAGRDCASIFPGTESPKFSIAVPVYNVEAELIRKCVASVAAQTHPNWELILYDDGSTNAATLAVLEEFRASDPRIKVWFSNENRGIATATNAAIGLSSGSFVAFLDNDDELTPDALAEMAQAIRANPDADLLYSDEDKLDETENYCDHYFKPDWSPEHLESVMYLLHLMVIRRSLLLDIGGLRDRFSGAQDYDLALRASRTARRIVHVPKILYHWRKIPGSAAAEVDAKPVALERAKEALQDHLDASRKDAVATPGLSLGLFRVRDAIPVGVPVTLAIFTDNRRTKLPGRGEFNLFSNFLTSIVSKTATACDMRILAIDNGNLSMEQRQEVDKNKGRVVSYDSAEEPFNFSKKANFAFNQVETELVVLLNDDMEIIEPGWLDALVELALRPTTGVVGGKLLYHTNAIQHCGVVLGINNNVAHVYHRWPADQIGYNSYTHLIRNYLAVTGACLATRMSIVSEVGGFDEALAIDYNDIDFCLKVFSAGYRNIYTPFAKLYHFEGLTAQRSTQNPKERKIFMERWHNYMSCDPYYNPNFSRQRLDFAAREPAQ